MFRPLLFLMFHATIMVRASLTNDTQKPTQVIFQKKYFNGKQRKCYGDCLGEDKNKEFKATFCGGNKAQLRCAMNFRIKIHVAVVGRTAEGQDVCEDENRLKCTRDVKSELVKSCEERQTCNLQVDNASLSDACGPSDKSAKQTSYFLAVTHYCEYGPTPPPTTTRKVTGTDDMTANDPSATRGSPILTTRELTDDVSNMPAPTRYLPQSKADNNHFWIFTAFAMLKDDQLIKNNKTHLSLAITLSLFIGFVLCLFAILYQCRKVNKEKLHNAEIEENEEFMGSESPPLLNGNVPHDLTDTSFVDEYHRLCFCNETPSPQHKPLVGELHGLVTELPPSPTSLKSTTSAKFPAPPKEMLVSLESLHVLETDAKLDRSPSPRYSNRVKRVQIIDSRDIENVSIASSSRSGGSRRHCSKKTSTNGRTDLLRHPDSLSTHNSEGTCASSMVYRNANDFEDSSVCKLAVKRRSLSEDVLNERQQSPLMTRSPCSESHPYQNQINGNRRNQLTQERIQKIIESSGLPLKGNSLNTSHLRATKERQKRQNFSRRHRQNNNNNWSSCRKHSFTHQPADTYDRLSNRSSISSESRRNIERIELECLPSKAYKTVHLVHQPVTCREGKCVVESGYHSHETGTDSFCSSTTDHEEHPFSSLAFHPRFRRPSRDIAESPYLHRNEEFIPPPEKFRTSPSLSIDDD